MADIAILDEASAELEAIAETLEEERTGHGWLFLDEYEAKLLQIVRFPASAPRIENGPPGTTLRAFSLDRFKVSIIVAIGSGTPVIVALADQRREPGYWRSRIR